MSLLYISLGLAFKTLHSTHKIYLRISCDPQRYEIIYLHKIKKWVFSMDIATVCCTIECESKYNLG
jgi:hypothetical protein